MGWWYRLYKLGIILILLKWNKKIIYYSYYIKIYIKYHLTCVFFNNSKKFIYLLPVGRLRNPRDVKAYKCNLNPSIVS